MNATTRKLYDALKASESAMREALDILHYEDGLPVTALEGWEIERAYDVLCIACTGNAEALKTAEGKYPNLILADQTTQFQKGIL